MIRLLAALLASFPAWGAIPIFPLKDVRAGQKAVGRTVFAGDRVEEFQAEILGVLENIGPKQSVILARLSGGPLAHTGVMQGMSGSPVYLDGKLMGAVALAFPFSKDPIAGIRPIEEMLAADRPQPRRAGITADNLLAGIEPRGEFGKLIEVATPVAFSGFTARTIDHFAPQLRALGLEPVQGVAGRGRDDGSAGSAIEPGSMISVELARGDLSIGADGTITAIDGDRVYAFGHRFLSVGSTSLPFAKAEVLTLLASTNTSFKISASRGAAGVIEQDRSTAIAGKLGGAAAMVPVEMRVGSQHYKMEFVNDRLLTPFLTQMAVFSGVDATERTAGVSTLSVKGTIEFAGAEPLKIDNVFASEAAAVQASLSAAVPLAFVMQGGFDQLRPRKITIEIDALESRQAMQLDQAFPSRTWARPGDTISLNVSLTGENGVSADRKVTYKVPVGMRPGPLYFTIADAAVTNFSELRQMIASPARSAGQLVSTVNALRPASKAFVRVWRPEPAYQVGAADLPDPPPSIAAMLARAQSQGGGVTQSHNSKLAELELDAGGAAITGVRTVQVEIKE